MSKPKIAIVGGGPAGLSTAFHLTNDPKWSDSIDSITVYQLGWRLGGKGSTGRNKELGWRIEEHGIHGFCNFYFNTWRMMETVFAELSIQNRALIPLKTLEDAFLGSSLTFGVEFVNGRWSSSTSHLPHWPGVPWGRSSFFDPHPLEIGRGILEQTIRRGRAGPIDSLDATDLIGTGARGATRTAHEIHEWLRIALLSASTLSSSPPDVAVSAQISSWISLDQQIGPALGGLLALSVQKMRIDGDITSYSALTTLDLYITLLRGLIADGLLYPGRDLDDFDHEDYRGWLKRHRAYPETLDSPSVYSIANMLFAYPGGDTSPGLEPKLSAASWLGWLLRSVTGRGEYFYLMAAGTGETAILPLFLLLKQRGVKFAFFHRLTSVTSALDGAERVVEELTFEKQADTVSQSEYDPLVGIGPFSVWPGEPVWERLIGGKSTEDFEAWKEPNRENLVLLKRGECFDYAVWAIPPSMIPEVGDAPLQKEWGRVTGYMTYTATQAAQVWLTKDTKDLGWPRVDPERYASATFPNPLNGMVGFDDLIRFENWSNVDSPRGLFYMCGPLALKYPLDESLREAERQKVRASLRYSLSILGYFLPGALPNPPYPNNSGQIDFDVLHSPGGGHQGPGRVLDQYVRANTRLTEAYVQAQAFSARGRLYAWATGYSNLVVAGDWIYTGINVGAFESAVTGGKLAAFALTGSPTIDEIEGYAFRHPRAAACAADALRFGIIPRIRQ